MAWDFDANKPSAGGYQLINGVCGNGARVQPDSVLDLNYALDSNLAAGAVEFDFRPSTTWDSTSSYMLLGNDGSRALFVYSNGILYFLKNQSDVFIYEQTSVHFSASHWSHIVGQWGPSGLTLQVDGVKAVKKSETSSYQPSPRTNAENEMKIGGKTYCCMEGVGLDNALNANGDYDNINIYSHEILKTIVSCPLSDSASILASYSFDAGNADSSAKLSTLPLVQGTCGTAAQVDSAHPIDLGHILPATMTQGSIEFNFQPTTVGVLPLTLLGNEGSRFQIIYSAGTLYYLKNYPDLPKVIKANMSLIPGNWYSIKADWGGQGMRLYINNEIVASNTDTTSYEESTRGDSNDLELAGKSSCCMEAIGIYTATTAAGLYDQIVVRTVQK